MSSLTWKTLKPWFVVFSAALFFFFEFINMNSFDALNLALRQTFHVNALQLSNMSAMYFYANVIFLIPAGLILDRVSVKKLLITGFLICIISNLVFATTDSFTIAKLCRFITGMGSTLCLLSTALLTSRWFKPKLAGLVMGLVITMAMLGGVVAQSITYFENLFGSWRYAIGSVALLGIIFLIIITIFVSDYPKEQEKEHLAQQQRLKNDGFWRSFGAALKNTQNWVAGLFTNFMNIPVMVLGALWGKDYLMTVHHLTADKASFVVSMIFFGTLIGSPLIGALSDRIGRRKLPMLLGAILTLLVALAILKFPGLNYIELSALFFFLGLFSGAQIITYPLLIESNPKHLTASSEALSATLIMSGGAVFQPLFGYVMQRVWQNNPHHIAQVYSSHAFDSAMMLLPAAFIISIVLSLFIKETFCRSYKEV